MTRKYAVKYKSKSKMLTTPEAVANTEKEIAAIDLVKSVKITDEGQVVAVEVAAEEDFSPVMDKVVNVFRRIDDKSEVSYKFGLNRDNG
ncbi:MAG: hypothetical protein Q4F11_05800 [Eubacteriales bacterium]|nr:hypothetical protein [Eubacteriales bacterium]